MKTRFTLIALLAGFPVELHAAQTAMNWNGSQAIFFSDDDGPFTLGFRFRADTDLTITSLGAFDYLGNGLAAAHTVAIWSRNGAEVLAMATVPAGDSTVLLGAFRYVGISDLTLYANTEYIIGASDFYGSVLDIYPHDPQGFSTAQGVTFLAARESEEDNTGLVFPDSDRVTGGSPLAANFQYVAIPEPSAAVLLSIGAAAMTRRFGFRRGMRQP